MQRQYKTACCLFFVFLFCYSAPVHGRTIYVSKAGDGTTGNTWETAFNTINSALVASVTNDELRVAAETYNETIEVATPLTIVGGYEPSGKEGANSSPTGRTTITAWWSGNLVQLFPDTIFVNFIVTGGQSGGGTGLRVINSDCTILNCVIDNNYADNFAAGISCYKATVTIQRCTISNNTTKRGAGGMYFTEAEVVLSDSVIFGNRSPGVPGAPEFGVPRQKGIGGGLIVGNSKARISNCVFYDNDAELGADIYFGAGGSLRCENCTFASCTYTNIYQGESPVGQGQAFNCIVWGHATAFRGDDWIVTYSDVLGGYPGAGNISEDPLFVNADGGDFHLQANLGFQVLGGNRKEDGSRFGFGELNSGPIHHVSILGRGLFQVPETDIQKFLYPGSRIEKHPNDRAFHRTGSVLAHAFDLFPHKARDLRYDVASVDPLNDGRIGFVVARGSCISRPHNDAERGSKTSRIHAGFYFTFRDTSL